MKSSDSVNVAVRVPLEIQKKLEQRRAEIKKLSGIEPTISAVIRSILEKEFNHRKAP